MRVLFVVPYVPSLVRVRPYNLVRHLSAAGHEVTVVTLWTSQQELRDAEALREMCHQVISLSLPRWRSIANCLRALPGRRPLQAVYCHSPALESTIREITGRAADHYDVAHVEHLRGALYGVGIELPKVWDAVDCISHLFEQAASDSRTIFGRLAPQMELARTRSFESWLLTCYDHVLVTSATDREALIGLPEHPGEGAGDMNDRAPITVLPNGVDLTYFAPPDIPREPATIVISGKMSYHANITAVLHFYHKVLPLIQSQRADIKLIIAGKDPSRVIALLDRDPSVTVTGYVPDLRPYLAKATLAVSPVLYGAGCQNKVLEAMATGTPVVCTSVSIRGIKAEAEKDVLVADDPRAMADSVLELIESEALRDRLARQARRMVEVHHNWGSAARHLESVYASLRTRVPLVAS